MGVDVWVLMVLMEASPGFDGGFFLWGSLRLSTSTTVWGLMFSPGFWVLVRSVLVLPFFSVPSCLLLPFYAGGLEFLFRIWWSFCCSRRVSSGGGGGFGSILEVG
ncbi:hypothetical protein QL285_005450 [Trifolium repens]|nr:hypothetical protein QL285_005450 [Trifolium repens]